MIMNTLMIGWTTVATKDAAHELAQAIVEKNLAACVHIEGPIIAVYHWQGRIQNDQEFRLMIKFPEKNEKALEKFIHDNHPYETPQWVTVKADSVAPEYLKWAYEVAKAGGS